LIPSCFVANLWAKLRIFLIHSKARRGLALLEFERRR
jgi:hypothetical protein